MEELIKRYFSVKVVEKEAEVSLDYEEKNALRYTTGYVIRSLKRKLQQSANPMKKELILSLTTITEDDAESDGVCRLDVDWIDSLDRGGLTHVNNMAYMLFTAMELALHQYLSTRRASEVSCLDEATRIINDDDVLFNWSILSVNLEETVAEELFEMIVAHWITLRGFSFAGALLEKYKQLNKKNVQKSKGVQAAAKY